MTVVKQKQYYVVFQVSYGPAGSGASWMEEGGTYPGNTPRQACRAFRKNWLAKHANSQVQYRVGRLVSVRLVNEKDR